MDRLVIFAKAPRVGLVKTRLAETIGKDRACDAYKELLRTLGGQLATVPHATICCSPEDAGPELRPFFPAHWEFLPQVGADLGTRLDHAVATAFRQQVTQVTVIGSDCPYLTADDITHAFQLLRTNDVVLGPAKDGGYWLIALKQPQPNLFREIDWGTDRVLAQTVARAKSHGLKVTLLRELSDIDTATDWQAFLAQR